MPFGRFDSGEHWYHGAYAHRNLAGVLLIVNWSSVAAFVTEAFVVVAGIGGLLKLSIDNNALREQIRKNTSDIRKADADVGVAAKTESAAKTRAESDATVAANATAIQWMEKFAGIIDELDSVKRAATEQERRLNARIDGQDEEIRGLKRQVGEIQRAKDGIDAQHKKCLSDLRDTAAKLLESEKSLTGALAKVDALQADRDWYKAGFDAAMILDGAAAGNRSDEKTIEIATQKLKEVLDYEAQTASAHTPRASPVERRKK